MMMDSDSSYKPNGDYHLVSPYGWHHGTQDLQPFAGNAPAVYAYGDYGPVVVKSEYDDCGGADGTAAGDGSAADPVDGGSGAGSTSSPGLEQDSSAEPKKGMLSDRYFNRRRARDGYYYFFGGGKRRRKSPMTLARVYIDMTSVIAARFHRRDKIARYTTSQ